ncbi:MAG: response regulator transcription factor [Oscillospiraceae bacterium]|nr:response regulator transcription factor [Oscillospiraceae bacterium]
MTVTILIAEDEKSIVRGLEAYLRQEGFETLTAETEEGAIELLPGADLALLDISLEEGSGFGVCRQAKRRGLPVIFLTASGDESSVVRGLDMGADDYVAKPFRPRELISRIRSVLRRSGRGQTLVQLGDAAVDTERGTVTRDGREEVLSALEKRLLMVFINNRGRLLGRDRLLEEIWDAGGDFVNDNTLTVYIKRLRNKLERDPQNPEIIRTVRGSGYLVD